MLAVLPNTAPDQDSGWIPSPPEEKPATLQPPPDGGTVPYGSRRNRRRRERSRQETQNFGREDVHRDGSAAGDARFSGLFGELLLRLADQHELDLCRLRVELTGVGEVPGDDDEEQHVSPPAVASTGRRRNSLQGHLRMSPAVPSAAMSLYGDGGDDVLGDDVVVNKASCARSGFGLSRAAESSWKVKDPMGEDLVFQRSSSPGGAETSAEPSSCASSLPPRRESLMSGPAQLLAPFEAIVVLPHWKETNSFALCSRRMSRARGNDIKEEERFVYGDQNSLHARTIGRMLILPCSLKRLCWDLIGFTFLCYDLVQIPFMSAFPAGESAFMTMMNWVTLMFWTLDMIASMMTGYQKGVDVIMLHKSIICNYLQSWFLADFILVSLDWFVIVAYDHEAASDAIRQGRSLRMLRYVRTLRLIRMMKLKKMLNEIQFHINTELLSTFFSIAKTMTALVAANHLIACAWFAIGSAEIDSERNWVLQNGLMDRDLGYQYTTSLHWSLTQFTPASMEIRPYNVAERSFSVVVLLLALVAFSSFLSTLTASITLLSSMRGREVRQFWLLRRYLRDLKISRELSLRVQRYCEYKWERRQRKIGERDVSLLAYVSEPLREEMKAETFAPFLSVHPLLEYLQVSVRHFINSLTSMELARGDTVFCYGEVAHEMIVVNQGELEYSMGEDEDSIEFSEKGDEESAARPSKGSGKSGERADKAKDEEDSNSSGSSADGEAIFEREWISEPALWTRWDHLGYLEALSECQLIVVNADKFGEVVCRHAASLTVAQKYAKCIIDSLNRIDRSCLSDVLDRELVFSAFEAVGGKQTEVTKSSSSIIRRKGTRTSFLNSGYHFDPKWLCFVLKLRLKTTMNFCKHRVLRL